MFEITGPIKPMTETGGTAFNVYLEGAEETKKNPQEAWTAAEFYAMHGFARIVEMLKEAGMPITKTEKKVTS